MLLYFMSFIFSILFVLTLQKKNQTQDENRNTTLQIIIVPYRHSIGKCFVVVFPTAYVYKIYSLKLYHLLNSSLHSKANAQALVLELIPKCRQKKNPKHLHIEFIVTSHNSVNLLQKYTIIMQDWVLRLDVVVRCSTFFLFPLCLTFSIFSPFTFIYSCFLLKLAVCLRQNILKYCFFTWQGVERKNEIGFLKLRKKKSQKIILCKDSFFFRDIQVSKLNM